MSQRFEGPTSRWASFNLGRHAMDRTGKLYKLYAELTVVKRGLEEFAVRRPNPREWTQEEVEHHDLLIKRRTDIRAEIAELESADVHRRRRIV
jgi:hypothetical protein